MRWERRAKKVKLSGDIVVKGFTHDADAIRLYPCQCCENRDLVTGDGKARFVFSLCDGRWV